MTKLNPRSLSSLPTTHLTWLSVRDHFIATVGPQSGQGQALGPLRVLADATFAPRSRFPLHGHQDMEILSIVIDGELSHHGDQAHGQTLHARSAQLISARDGIVHAEGNDTDVATRMLQIWFTPDALGGAPAYFTRTFVEPGRHLICGDEAMPLRANARVWWVDVLPDRSERFVVSSPVRGYLLAMTTSMRIEADNCTHGVVLAPGEGVLVEDGAITLSAESAGAALWIEAG